MGRGNRKIDGQTLVARPTNTVDIYQQITEIVDRTELNDRQSPEYQPKKAVPLTNKVFVGEAKIDRLIAKFQTSNPLIYQDPHGRMYGLHRLNERKIA